MASAFVKESTVDVLVVGAGPAGLMCANALAMAGVNVRIIDQRPTRVATGHADGVQTRTIEIMQSYGFGERIMREGNHLYMTAVYSPSPSGGIERTSRILEGSGSTARYPFMGVTLNQGAIEAMFLDSMEAHEVSVERPVVPVSLELSNSQEELTDPGARPVKITLKHIETPENGEHMEVVHAKFVVGTDGAHSWVRKALGITLEGEQTEYVWGVLDMVADTDFPDIRCKCAVHSNNGSCLIIPRENDLVRLYIQLSDQNIMDPATGRVDKSKMGPEELLEVAKKSLRPFEISASGEIDWWTLYTIGQRVATRFSVSERAFIAGDACHTHSPKAGQGMNASMSDTHNLGAFSPFDTWKLVYVLRGWANLSLLKTYEFERWKYAQDLIDLDKRFTKIYSDKPRSETNPDGVSREAFKEAFETFGLFTSGIGVYYEPSAITANQHQSCAAHLVVGQRVVPHVFIRVADARPYDIQDLLPSDTRFNILVFAGNVADAAQAARVQKLAEDMEKPEGFLKRFGQGEHGKVFDILSICSTWKQDRNYTALPRVLRPHWSKVLLDDTDMYTRVGGGGGYETYGIDTEKGAIVVARPDGYVGIVAPFEGLEDVNAYFAAFMV